MLFNPLWQSLSFNWCIYNYLYLISLWTHEGINLSFYFILFFVLFLFPAFLWFNWIIFRIYFDLSVVFVTVSLCIAFQWLLQVYYMYVHDSTQPAGSVILPVQIKCKYYLLLHPLSCSIYKRIIKYFFYINWESHNVIILCQPLNII